MTYQEWIALPEEQMVAANIDDLVNMFDSIIHGSIEPDNEKQAKLANFMLVVMCAGVMSHDFEYHQKLQKIGNSIINLMPDDTHSQSFVLGAMSVFVTFANTVKVLADKASS